MTRYIIRNCCETSILPFQYIRLSAHLGQSPHSAQCRFLLLRCWYCISLRPSWGSSGGRHAESGSEAFGRTSNSSVCTARWVVCACKLLAESVAVVRIDCLRVTYVLSRILKYVVAYLDYVQVHTHHVHRRDVQYSNIHIPSTYRYRNPSLVWHLPIARIPYVRIHLRACTAPYRLGR